MKKFTLLVLFSLALTVTNAQTGPGGVLNSTNNRIWIAVNEATNTINNSNIASIPDISGNGFDVSINVPSWMPKYKTNGLNTYPTAVYTSGKRLFSYASDATMNTSDITIISVLKTTNDLRQMGVSITYSNSNWVGSYTNTNTAYINRLSSVYRIGSFKAIPTAPAFNNFQIFTQLYGSNNLQTYLNSSLDNSANIAMAAQTGHSSFGIGGITTTSYYGLKGEFAETMVFNQKLNPTQRIIIENYLSSKYAIDISASGNDYYTNEGTGHYHEVFGIGQLNGQANTVAQGTGILEVSNANDLADNEMLFIGHDDQDFTLFNGDVPAFLPDAERWARTWRVSETGEVGTVTLTFDMSGGIGFGSPLTSYRLLIDPNQDGNFSDVVSAPTGTFDVNAQTLTFTGINLSDGDYFTVAADRAIISINGGGNWTDPTTWNCNCVPTHLDSAIIDNGDVVIVNQDTAIKGLLIHPTGTLDLSTNNLDIRRNLTINGDILASNGSLTFNGDLNTILDLGGQSFNFNDITMDGDVTTTFTAYNGNAIIDGTFFPTSGTMEDGSATFIINSTAANQSGSVGPIGTNATINEPTFSVRRFIPGGAADWRNISSPLNSIAVTELADDLPISGSGMPLGCSYGPDGCYATLRYINGSNYDTIPVHNVNHVMVNGRGYEIFMGDDLVTLSPTIYSVSGSLQSKTDITVDARGYELIGNPYASAIDFNELQRTGAVGNYFYVLDVSTGTNVWQWYDGGSNTSSNGELANGIIAMHQGFWVENVGTVTFSQDAKVSASGTFIRSSGIKHSLSVENNTSGKKATFTIMQNASADLNRDIYDIPAMPRMVDMDHILFGAKTTDGSLLTVNKISGFDDKVSMPLSLNVLEEGTYTMTSDNFEALYTYNCIQVYDAKNDEVISITENMSYEFDVEETDEDINRFYLILNKQNCATVSGNNSVASIEENVASESVSIVQKDRIVEFMFNLNDNQNFTIEVYNSLGQTVMNTLQWNVTNGRRTLQIPENIHGVLMIKATSSNHQSVRKIFVK